jgi:hypothetical protein
MLPRRQNLNRDVFTFLSPFFSSSRDVLQQRYTSNRVTMASSEGEVRAAQELEQILLMALSDDDQSRDYADVRKDGGRTRQNVRA